MNSKTAGLQPYTEFLWSREDYEDLVRKGVFGPQDHVELLDGELTVTADRTPPYSTSIGLTSHYLAGVYFKGAVVFPHSPLALDDHSMPEPGLAVVPGAIRPFSDRYPTTASLVAEIAESSLDRFRGPKLRAYARAGIPEYWIVNLIDRVVEVYRHPSGERYEQSRTVHPGSTLAPAGHDDHPVDPVDLLP